MGGIKCRDNDLIKRSQVLTVVLEAIEGFDFPKNNYSYRLLRSVYGEVAKRVNGLPATEAVEAIPVEWVEEHIKWLKSLENAFSNMTAMNIEVMLKKWREEQK